MIIHLPFARIVTFASRTPGSICFESILAHLSALLRNAGSRKGPPFHYGFAIYFIGGPHGTGYFSTIVIHAPANQTVPRALSTLVSSI